MSEKWIDSLRKKAIKSILSKVNGQQVHHYEVSQKFRIHGILEEGRFKVIRLDPNHKVHR